MKLHSPRFEAKLRRKVKRAVQSSRELKREFRANSSLQHYSLFLVVRPLFCLGVGFAVWGCTQSFPTLASPLAVITLWTALFVFIHAQGLQTRLYGSPDLSALFMLPISIEQIFRWEFQKFSRRSLWSLLDLIAAFGTLAWSLGLLEQYWPAAVGIAVLTWVTVLALAGLCAAYVPWLAPLVLPGGFIALIGVALAEKYVTESVIMMLLDRYAPVINLVIPTGWPAALFQVLTPKGDSLAFAMLVPVLGLLVTIPFSLARLRSRYEVHEPIQDEAHDLIPGEELQTETVAERPPMGVSAIEDIVRSRQFLTIPAWRELGWFERKLWDWLSEREKALADFVFPAGLSISTEWRKIARNVAVVTVTALAVGWLFPSAKAWILIGGFFITSCQALGNALGSGRAFHPNFSSGVATPMYSAYAIGFRELSQLLFKCTAVNVPMIVSYSTLISAALVAGLGGPSIGQAALMGFKAGLLLVTARFITVTFGFSAGTNDSSGLRWRTAALVVVMLGSAGMFLGLGAAALLVSNQLLAWSCLLLAALDAYAFHRCYGYFFDANRFDLMNVPQQQL